MEIISRTWIQTREGDYFKNMDTDKRRRLFQEYGYRREKEIISRIWIQTGEGDYIKNRDTTVDGNYIKNMDTDER